MSDYVTNCSQCDRMIALDEPIKEIRNQYGYPVPFCEVCAHQYSGGVSIPRGCHPDSTQGAKS